MGNEEKRARHEPHSECLHNGIILIVYILQIVLQRYNNNLTCTSDWAKKYMLYDFRKKIQGIVITSCCRVEERKIIVACIYFAWRCDVVKKKKDTGYYVCY